MISCNLKGGLGNQMFQIAATHALALRNNTTSVFNLETCYTPLQGNPSNKYKNNIFSKIKTDSTVNIDKIYYEKSFSYNQLPNDVDLILDGYFQSEKYFYEYKKDIIELFNISDVSLINDFLVGFRGMKLPITTIHVRRGDYLSNPDFHPTCSLEYYRKAMEEIGESSFIFISDDIAWVKENFKGNNIWYSNFTNEIDDFKLMTVCDNNIMSNSSFSWWGAYLNPNIDKKIITPNRWFGPKGPKDTQDLIPQNWVIIDV